MESAKTEQSTYGRPGLPNPGGEIQPNFVIISPGDERFRCIFESFPNIGAFVVIDTKEPDVTIFGVEGRAVRMDDAVNIPAADGAQMAPSSLLEYSVSDSGSAEKDSGVGNDAAPAVLATAVGGTKCKWMNWNGLSILISGDPRKCVRRG
jgi:hypothetical protein